MELDNGGAGVVGVMVADESVVEGFEVAGTEGRLENSTMATTVSVQTSEAGV